MLSRVSRGISAGIGASGASVAPALVSPPRLHPDEAISMRRRERRDRRE